MTGKESEQGHLYIVATPIGHLGDLTQRAVETLGQVDLVAAEDTRRTRKLLSHLRIKVELISYREQNRGPAGKRILDALAAGRDVALVSDAGTPVISDPGAELVQRAVVEKLPVIPIPGPSAVAAALSVSGIQADRYTFAGFPPAKAKARQEFFEELVLRRDALVFFEAPHRLAKSLADMLSVFGLREAVLCRELTKVNEEIIRSDLGELASWAAANRVRGEITLVLAGAAPEPPQVEPETILKAWKEARSQGLSPSRAAQEVAANSGLSRSRIYKMGLDHELEASAAASQSAEGEMRPDREPERPGMQEPLEISCARRLTVTAGRGLHARSATRIIKLLQEFECRVWFEKDGQVVEGDSILALLTLNCPRGSVVEVRAAGTDSEECLDRLGLLFARNFDED